MKSNSGFEEFVYEALDSEELPTIVGGIEVNDDLSSLSDEVEFQIEE